VEIEVLSASLILVASLCGGLCAVFIARSKSTVNKHSRQRIKDFENDIQYLADSKKEEAKDYRQEILRLKSSINRIKEGTEITKSDINNSSGISDIVMKLVPNKYRDIAKSLLPKVEAHLIEHPEVLGNIKDEILKANSKQTQVQPQAQESTTL